MSDGDAAAFEYYDDPSKREPAGGRRVIGALGP